MNIRETIQGLVQPIIANNEVVDVQSVAADVAELHPNNSSAEIADLVARETMNEGGMCFWRGEWPKK